MRKRRNRRRRRKDLPRPKRTDTQTTVNAFCCPFCADTSHTRTFGVAFLLGIDVDISARMSLFEVRFWMRERFATDPLLLPEWHKRSAHDPHETGFVSVRTLTDKVNTLCSSPTVPPPFVSSSDRTRILQSLTPCNARSAARPGCILDVGGVE